MRIWLRCSPFGPKDLARELFRVKMALVQPKKPAGGAYGQFLNEKRADFVKEVKGQPITAVTKLASAKWQAPLWVP